MTAGLTLGLGLGLVVGGSIGSSGSVFRPTRSSVATTVLADRVHEVAALRASVTALRKEVELLAAQQSDEASRIHERTMAEFARTGATAVSGPGVVVTLNDAPIPEDGMRPGTTSDDYVVHQQDVEAVMNALWRGGAEAMAVMDQRVTSLSGVRCAGNVLVLQGRVYSPPFRISAIGDSGALLRALDDEPAVEIYQEYVSLLGLGYGAEVVPDLQIGAYVGRTDMQYAAAAG